MRAADDRLVRPRVALSAVRPRSALVAGRLALTVLCCALLGACTMPKRAPSPDEWQEVVERDAAVAAPTAPPAVAVIAAPRPSPPAAIVVGAKPLVRPPPRYPPSLREDVMEGRVVATFVVDTDGLVAGVQIERTTHPAFADAVRAALTRWRFEPARSATGEAVASKLRMPFQFRRD